MTRHILVMKPEIYGFFWCHSITHSSDEGMCGLVGVCLWVGGWCIDGVPVLTSGRRCGLLMVFLEGEEKGKRDRRGW